MYIIHLCVYSSNIFSFNPTFIHTYLYILCIFIYILVFKNETRENVLYKKNFCFYFWN